MTLEPGEMIAGRYRLERSLGEGGFGMVWLAEEVVLGRKVAVKFLKDALAPDDRVRFQREMTALGRLAHDHVLQLFSTGEHNAAPFIVTEYVDGQTLRQWLGTPRRVDEIVVIAHQVASALAAAHREGIIHRDLKPPNIMVVERRGPFVKVLDFGIARVAGRHQPDITKTGEIIGTPGFMSPEQLRGRTDIGPATDLYNLGVLLWEMIEGRPMFTADTALGICMLHLTTPPPPLTRPVPEFFGRLIFQLLDKNPEKRGTAETALRVLQERRDAPRHARSATALAPDGGAQAESSRPRLKLLVLSALIVVSTGVVIASVFPRSEPAEPTPPQTAPKRVDWVRATAEPEPLDSNSVDAGSGTVDVGPVGAGTPGCGVEREPGRLAVSYLKKLRWIHGLERDDDGSIIVIPPGYNPDIPAPVVLILLDAKQAPHEMFQEAKTLVQLAGEDGAIMVFAEGQRSHEFTRALKPVVSGEDVSVHRDYTWPDDRISELPRLLDLVKGALCVDSGRVFLVGDGRGARGAEKLLAMSGESFSAVALTGYRLKAEHSLDIASRVPRLWILPTEGLEIIREKRNQCEDKYELRPIAEQHEALLKSYGCEGKPRKVEASGGTCRTWQCEVQLVSCRANGGHHWPDYAGKHDECSGEPSKFDYGKTIWSFFKTVSQKP